MNKLSDDLIDGIARRFRALGDPTRIRILQALLGGERPANERTVGELAELLSVAPASMSKHLALLRDEGLLTIRRRGTQAYYSIRDPTLNDLCRLVCDGVTRTAGERHAALTR